VGNRQALDKDAGCSVLDRDIALGERHTGYCQLASVENDEEPTEINERRSPQLPKKCGCRQAISGCGGFVPCAVTAILQGAAAPLRLGQDADSHS